MTKVKIPYEEAVVIAEEIKDLISPYCEEVVIAGSVRRRKDMVGDIELVCKPKIGEVAVRNTLFPMTADGSLLDEHLRQLWGKNVIDKRYKKDGSPIAWFNDRVAIPRYLAATYQDKIGVDFFIVNADRADWWGWTLYLRTGPSEGNMAMVTAPPKGLLPPNLTIKDGIIYLDGVPHPTPTEADVFAAWGLDYIPPDERTPEKYIRLVRNRR